MRVNHDTSIVAPVNPENLKMATATAMPHLTVTVKITPALAQRIAERYSGTPLSEMYDRLEPWVEKMFKGGVARAMKRKHAEFDKRDGASRTATVRIPRHQLRRLLIVAPVYGRTVGSMIEEKLWEMLA